MTEAARYYRAILFDFDFTLGDSSGGIIICVQYALEQMGYEPGSPDAIRKTIGLSLPQTFEQLTGIQNAALGGQFAGLFRQKADKVMTAHTHLLPGTIPFLSALKNNGLKTGIITTKFHYRIDEILEKFGVSHLIDVIVGCEDVKNVKPDPDGLLLALSKLAISKDSALFVGDSVIDAKAACGAGIDFIAVTTGTTGREAFTNIPHRHIADSLMELASHILADG